MSDTRKCDICGKIADNNEPMDRFFHRKFLVTEADIVDICDNCMKVIARESKKVGYKNERDN